MASVLNGMSFILIKKCLRRVQVKKILFDTMIAHPKQHKMKVVCKFFT